MKLLTLDFETYYSATYSLSKLTTEEYIRDPRFEVIGVGMQFDDGERKWYPQPEVAAVLGGLDWSNIMLLCQNTAFDAGILAFQYHIHPKALADTLGMSRALYPHEKSHSLKMQAQRMGLTAKGSEVDNAIGLHFSDFRPQQLQAYGEYCLNDVMLTKQLFDLYLKQGFPMQELKLIDLTLKLFTQPVLRLDVPALQGHLADVKRRKADLIEKIKLDVIGSSADEEFIASLVAGDPEGGVKKILMSNERFANLLTSYGVDPPTKVSPKTKKVAYAFAKTDEAFKALLEHEDDRVQAVVSARLGIKTTIEETRTERFIGMAARGAFPVPLRYYGAHSGRWSGQDSVNMQNLPARGPNAGRIKKAIKAPPGYVVIDCDSSQIEARTLAWLAGQTDLVQAFEDKQDVYRIMASRIYGIAPDQIAPLQRQVGKTVILGAGYGVGHAKLKLFLKNQAGVDVSEQEARNIINTYRRTYSKIPELWDRGERALGALYRDELFPFDVEGLCTTIPTRGIRLPSELYIQYPGLARVVDNGSASWMYLTKGVANHVYGGKVVENVCQAVARCVIAEQMLRIAKRYKVVLTVHDAIAIVAKVEEADAARAFVEQCMSWRPKWAPGLPLACESGMGATYGDC